MIVTASEDDLTVEPVEVSIVSHTVIFKVEIIIDEKDVLAKIKGVIEVAKNEVIVYF